MLHILIAHCVCNILHCHISILQKRLGTLHADMCHMLPKGLGGFVLKIFGNVRLTGDNFESYVCPIKEAREVAKKEGLDLIEIAPNAEPPKARVILKSAFLKLI